MNVVVSIMKLIATTLLCSLLLATIVTADERQNDERGLQVVLCRCEKRKEKLYNRRRLRGGDEKHRNLETFQDSQGYYIVDGIRVLPRDDADCKGAKKRKNSNIFDNRQLRSIEDETDEQETQLDEEVTEGKAEDGEGLEPDTQRELKKVSSSVGLIICMIATLGSRFVVC
jgi:hypothetical protein